MEITLTVVSGIIVLEIPTEHREKCWSVLRVAHSTHQAAHQLDEVLVRQGMPSILSNDPPAVRLLVSVKDGADQLEFEVSESTADPLLIQMLDEMIAITLGGHLQNPDLEGFDPELN